MHTEPLVILTFAHSHSAAPHCRRLPDLLLSALQRSSINTERDFESVHNFPDVYRFIYKTGRYRNAVLGREGGREGGGWGGEISPK